MAKNDYDDLLESFMNNSQNIHINIVFPIQPFLLLVFHNIHMYLQYVLVQMAYILNVLL